MSDSINFDSTRLRRWFSAEKRELPWRMDPTPYQVWVSEVMLQQTQVAVVIPYYLRWMELFPTIHALAAAEEQQVIKAWEGLGYYSRARNLHQGAKYLSAYFEGVFPEDHTLWSQIKGLGPYTTGAIRSFAFHQKAAAVDGNVVRVLVRYFNLQEDISKSASMKKLREYAEKILPGQEHWIHNEALIELGATICTKNPHCSICPLKTSCQAHLQGTAKSLPFNSRKISITKLHRAVAVIRFGQGVYVKRCAMNEVMAGLYEFPYCELLPDMDPEAAVKSYLQQLSAASILSSQQLPPVSHSFTRYQVSLYPILFEVKDSVAVAGCSWMPMEEVAKMAFSSGHRKILHQLKLGG